MMAVQWLPRLVWWGSVFLTCILSCGCAIIPRSELAALRTQNRGLAEQNRAQLAEIENLKIHSRNTEDQLMRTEEDLALLEEQLGLDRKQLANYQQERAALRDQCLGALDGRSPLPSSVQGRLADISERYPALQFDPRTGNAKLDTDILFDTGKAELKPGAEEVLAAVAEVLKAPDGRDLRLLVAGHTDNQKIAKKPCREKYPNNFHLSAARALKVADQLRAFGVHADRMGVAGFGPHQPIAPNGTPSNRQKNRRVEIFVMAPEVPVVGWTESIPSVY